MKRVRKWQHEQRQREQAETQGFDRGQPPQMLSVADVRSALAAQGFPEHVVNSFSFPTPQPGSLQQQEHQQEQQQQQHSSNSQLGYQHSNNRGHSNASPSRQGRLYFASAHLLVGLAQKHPPSYDAYLLAISCLLAYTGLKDRLRWMCHQLNEPLLCRL